MNDRKIGAGHASAMFRQGLRELRGAVYPDSNIAQQTEYGVFGTETPGEVAQARRGDGRELGEEADRSVLADRMRQVEARDVSGHDSKPMEMER